MHSAGAKRLDTRRTIQDQRLVSSLSGFESFLRLVRTRTHARHVCIRVRACAKEDGREEGPEEGLKASELSPSIVEFSYKFLLDVNSKAASVGAQSQLEGGG